MDDLKTHKSGIFDQLQQILTTTIAKYIEEGKSKVEWDKPLEKGDRVVVNQYMQNIVKDINNMHKILTNILP